MNDDLFEWDAAKQPKIIYQQPPDTDDYELDIVKELMGDALTDDEREMFGL